ncbi:MAG TPA: hypothetical protein VHG08_25825 [Longimicrobium sp.]|nr:hypothetical protein [Longimicrobium sp.]
MLSNECGAAPGERHQLARQVGVWLLFLAVRWQVREFARMWRNRHLRDAVHE